MPHRSTDVYRYLIYLQKYLLGDLGLFHQLAKNAENKEIRIKRLSENKGCLSIFSGKQSTTTSSASIISTKYPYSFEFLIGAVVVSRATIPNTATLFSTIDVLGFFTRTGNDYSSTTKNFTEFFSYPSTTIDPLELSVLINVYRHGMTHNYLPKLNVEIKYHSTNPPGKLFFKSPAGNLILNINRLEEIVKGRLDEIIKDASLYHNMNSQLSIMTADYILKSSASIAALLATL